MSFPLGLARPPRFRDPLHSIFVVITSALAQLHSTLRPGQYMDVGSLRYLLSYHLDLHHFPRATTCEYREGDKSGSRFRDRDSSPANKRDPTISPEEQ